MAHKHVVVIFPHPDDEAFGAAGTIARFRAQGVPVTYLCGTLGEMGRNMGNPTFANRETLPQIRQEELVKACQVLDINLEQLGYRDKTLEFEPKRDVAKHLYSFLEKIKPTLVISYYPGYAVHPDHDAFGAAAIAAVELIEPSQRPEVWALAIKKDKEKDLGEPQIYYKITDTFEKKYQAIVAHKSQAAGILGGINQGPDQLDAIVKNKLSTETFYRWEF
ncbi:bacillithiol biosynthesis deacetylase BshB2 [Amphibacillus marinus]|uniref:Bacillithiol biosynthesis deacetylase BshB2 n=1 Tax=Amphibacillus marinus TaxID=872970 RepID=A0A1H8RRT9_9BACI|nr:bacillithiol biosynthesis deacetylase BshB2 [Amphibacillus marinus]SEO68878.1 bacillithiol biosynthesis deacetylase BshB2 [Amphibacillus marinus]